MPLSQKIQNEQYRNWIRAVIGLCFLQEGLRDFVERVVKAQHAKTLQNVRTILGCSTAQCKTCPVKGILPAHAGTACIMKNGRLCNCRRKNNKHCSFCSSFYDDIIRLHRYNDPNWDTDASKWCTDHWQFARCFLTTTNKNGNNNASETDAAGLLSIIINATFFQNEISSVINSPYDDFSQARLARNEIIHSSTFELDDTEVCRYLQMMIIALEDPKTLLNDPSAKEAAEKIKQLQNDKLVITTEKEAQAIQVVLEALESKKLECIKEIERKEHESLETIQSAKDKAVVGLAKRHEAEVENKDKIEKLSADVQNIDTRLSATEMAVASIQSEVGDLKEEVLEIRNLVSVIEDQQKQHKERFGYLQNKKALQTHLMEQYEEFLSSDISPFLPEEDVHLSKVFVPVKMNRTYRTNPNIQGKTKTTSINCFHDVLYTDGKLASDVLVCGDAGTGKTTFCKALICKWCETHFSDRYDERLVVQTIIEGNWSNSPHTGALDSMETFELLFYVSLRHAYDEKYVEEMISNQLLYPEQKSVLFDILSVEPEVCLVILDGLDEWSPVRRALHSLSNSCFPKARCRYTKITTSRPYKFDSVHPTLNDIDINIKLEGIGQMSIDKLTKSTVLELNKKFQARLFFWKFQDEVKRMRLEELCKTPILLKLLICLWYDEQSLGKSHCGIYCSILNVLLKHANERFKHDKSFHILKSSVTNQLDQSLPPCFDEKYACKEIPSLLISLSKLAFRALFSEDRSTSLVFQHDIIKKHGLSEEELELSKKIGLLSVSQVPGRSVINRYQCFSFPHKSLQEFLSALYISIMLDLNQPQEQIIQGFDTLNTLRQNAAVLKFLCGLDAIKASFLSKHIAFGISQEKTIQDHRSNLKGSVTFEESISFEGHYNSQCSPVVSEVQAILHECIMEGNECGHTSLKLHISDLDIDINTKIRTCALNLDMSSLVSVRIHDERSAVENDFLNSMLTQECTSLKRIVLENVSLTKEQLSQLMSNTLALELYNIDFCDISDERLKCTLHSVQKAALKIKNLVISGIKLPCDCFIHLISYLFTVQSLEELTLKEIKCISPCRRNYHTVHETVQGHLGLKRLELTEVAVTPSILDLIASASFASETLQEIKLKNITCSVECSCIRLHYNHKLDHSTEVSFDAKYIFLENVPIDRNSFRESYTTFRLSESVVLRNLELSQPLMDEILSFIVDSRRLKRLSICKVDCTLSSPDEDSVLDYNFILPECQLTGFCTFRLSDVLLSHNQMELIISILTRASQIEVVFVTGVRCANHDQSSKDNCPFNEILQLLHRKTRGLSCLTSLKTYKANIWTTNTFEHGFK